MWAVEGLILSGGEIPQNYDDMIQVGKLGSHGTNRYSSRGSNTISNIGRGADYHLARLDRDRPDLAAIRKNDVISIVIAKGGHVFHAQLGMRMD